jgi:GntR family transcriptional repressor for pyruvate dehydrogenase complex
MYTPVQTGRLYEQIVEQIETHIIGGQLQPGDKLPSELELARQFGVSRTAVREAMKALSHKGLIDVSAGRGTYVTDSIPRVMRSTLGMLKMGLEEGTRYLTEVRDILEPEIAALAASRREEEHISAMMEAYAAMEASMQQEDIDAFIESDLDFHLALAEAAQNPLIPILIDSIVDLLRESRARVVRIRGGVERAQSLHKVIMEAVVAGDPEAAREAMQAHLRGVQEIAALSGRDQG